MGEREGEWSGERPGPGRQAEVWRSQAVFFASSDNSWLSRYTHHRYLLIDRVGSDDSRGILLDRAGVEGGDMRGSRLFVSAWGRGEAMV